MTHPIKIIVAAALLFSSAHQTKGFALLGPFADWMQPSTGFYPQYETGGPMALDEEYRWNVPLVTYGFDQSFLDYFGSNGVVAVEQAFQTLNALPPASSLELGNFSTTVSRANQSAEIQHLIDLKTMTLGMMLEQLGLTQPARSIFVLRQWNPILEIYYDESLWSDAPEPIIPTYILERNFDPESLIASHSVNDTLYGGVVFWDPNDVVEYPLDPTDYPTTAVADLDFQPGRYFTDLSADDAGGLRYLLRTNNVNPESLLPDVRGVGGGTNFVNEAMRPGIDKITFVQQQFEPVNHQWIPMTNQFTDTYETNNHFVHQTLERVIVKPDFLFCAGDTGLGDTISPVVARRVTTQWQNNGSAGALGPGVIRPPVRFVFNRIPPTLYTFDYLGIFGTHEIRSFHWASFDLTTNTFIYPVENFHETNPFTVRFRLSGNSFEWTPNVLTGETVLLQTSTNLLNWDNAATITNTSGVFEWNHSPSPSQPQRFFRVIPE